jgi:hypothetical protein
VPDTKTKTINGDNFEISQPYAEGQTITAIEARVLNQTRSENIGNDTRAKLKEMKDAGKSLEEMQAYVSEIDKEYEFTAAQARAAAKLDPYEKEAQKIAREQIKLHLAADGRKLSVAPEGYTEEQWKEKIDAEVERVALLPEVVKAAKQVVDARKKQGESIAAAMAEGSTL